MKVDGDLITEPAIIAEHFNYYFHSGFSPAGTYPLIVADSGVYNGDFVSYSGVLSNGVKFESQVFMLG